MSETLSSAFSICAPAAEARLLLAKAMAARDAEICRRFRAGEFGGSIGASYGISRERVRQILKVNGLTKHDGGAYVRGVKTRSRIADWRAAKQAETRARQVAFINRAVEIRISGKTWYEVNAEMGRNPASAAGLQSCVEYLIKRHNLPHLLEAIHSYDGRCRNMGGAHKAVSE